MKKIERILIIGNSITLHGASEEIGWAGNWGMAASKEENDYVHHLISKVNKINPEIKFKYQNVADYERDYKTFDLENMNSLRMFDADLIIMRIGENISCEKVRNEGLKEEYLNLIDYLNLSGHATIICTSRFWKEPIIDEEIECAAKSRNYMYVYLGDLDVDINKAIGLYPHEGVAAHPGDAGMEAIANRIWEYIRSLFQN